MRWLRWISCASLVSTIGLACGDDGQGGGSAESSGGGSTSSTSMPSTSTTASTASTASTGTTGTEASSGSGSSTGVDTTSEESSSGSTATGTTGLGDCRPLLVEAFYDAEGGNDQLQWVELYNPCEVAIDLSTWSIGYGGTDYGPPRVNGLTGTVDAGGCYVVGGPTADATNGQPTYQYADDFAPDLDTAEEAGGGIALFDLPEAEVDATTIPIDAVVYGSDNANGLIDETGRPVAVPHVGSSGAGASIQRTSEDATWIVAPTPAPNDCPPF